MVEPSLAATSTLSSVPEVPSDRLALASLPKPAANPQPLAAYRNRLRLFLMLTALVDVGIMLVAVYVGYWVLTVVWPYFPADWRDTSGYLHPSLHIWYKTAVIAFSITALYTFAVHGLYRPYLVRERGPQIARVVRAVSVLAAFYYFAVWIDRMHYCFERQVVIVVAWAVSVGALIVWRAGLVARYLGSTAWQRNTLILGAGSSAKYLAKQRSHFERAGYRLVGVLTDDPALAGPDVAGLPVLGQVTDADLAKAMSQHQIQDVVLAMPNLSHDRLLELVAMCKRHGVPIRVVSELWSVLSEKLTVDTIRGVPLVTVKETPLAGLGAVAKRLMDVVGSAAALIVLAPVFAAVALGVKLSSPGPIFFPQMRVGQHGRPFRYYKFRSMAANNDDTRHREYVQKLIQGQAQPVTAPDGQKVLKLADDPRVTRFGRFIRKYSLDELPQFWNVLKGDMSLVGPRPPLPYEVEKYSPWHLKRLEVRPGLTGLWQVSGRSSVNFDDMVVLDTYYIENWSLWLDVKILFLTPAAVVTGRGGY